jgi:uncharacterized membrane protein/protein-disulfide isomerase
MTRTRRFVILAFALVGLGASSSSTYVHYRLVTDPTYASPCDLNASVSCTDAYLSAYGSLMGVPVALLGVVFFLAVLLLAGWAARPASVARETAATYLLLLSTAGIAFAAYLAWASYAVLGVFCPLCAITYVSLLALWITAFGGVTVPATSMPHRLGRDLRTLLTSPLGLALALVLAGGSVAAIALFPHDEVQEDKPLGPEERQRLEASWNAAPKVDLPLAPSEGVKVQIVMFSDYQCPGCRAAHETLRRVLPRYDRATVEFVMKHYPLEPECNPNVPNGNHLAACEAAAAYVMARGSGFQQKLDDWFFANQSSLTPEVVRKAAAEIAGIKDFDARYERALQEVKTDASLGGFVQVRSTPTVFLNGRMIAGNGKGLVPAAYVDALIDIELKR